MPSNSKLQYSGKIYNSRDTGGNEEKRKTKGNVAPVNSSCKLTTAANDMYVAVMTYNTATMAN